MICSHCNTEIAEGTNFCAKCGKPLKQEAVTPQEVTQKKRDTASYVLLAFFGLLLLFMLFHSAFFYTVPVLFEKSPFEAPFIYFYYAINILSCFIYILPAFAVKKLWIKALCILLALIYIGCVCVQNVYGLMTQLEVQRLLEN